MLSHLDGVQRIHDHMLQYARNSARRHIDTHTGGGQRFVVVYVHGGSDPAVAVMQLYYRWCANIAVVPLQWLLLLR